MTLTSTNEHKRAILYARVSTDEQADKGYSLPSQFEAMRKYAEREGFEVVAEFQDDYSGATPIELRPDGSKAYAMLKSDAADAIIAYTIDRYVRPPEDGDEWELPILIRGLAKLGKQIHTVRRGKLNTNFADLLIALLDARKAGEERRDIRERSMRGKQAKAKAGKVVGAPISPYGYTFGRDEHGKAITLVIVHAEGRVVKLIFRWYVYGDETGKPLSQGEIARRLTAMLVPPPGISRGMRRKNNRAHWYVGVVAHILKNDTYIGTWRFGVNSGKTRRPESDHIKVDVPPLIDRETWELARARAKYNKQMSKRNCKREYLLRGMIRCSCKYAMGGHYKGHIKSRYYQCLFRSSHHEKLGDRPCRERMVRADAVEADVWGEIEELFSDLDRLWNQLKEAQQRAADSQKPIRDKLQVTEELIKEAESELDDIAMAMRAARGRLVGKFEKQQDEVDARLDELAKQREKLLAELGKRVVSDDDIDDIMKFARDVREGIVTATEQDKRRNLERLGVQVTVANGRYHIKCLVAEASGEIRKVKKPKKGTIVPSSH